MVRRDSCLATERDVDYPRRTAWNRGRPARVNDFRRTRGVQQGRRPVAEPRASPLILDEKRFMPFGAPAAGTRPHRGARRCGGIVLGHRGRRRVSVRGGSLRGRGRNPVCTETGASSRPDVPSPTSRATPETTARRVERRQAARRSTSARRSPPLGTGCMSPPGERHEHDAVRLERRALDRGGRRGSVRCAPSRTD